jgi:hypothetical protein
MVWPTDAAKVAATTISLSLNLTRLPPKFVLREQWWQAAFQASSQERLSTGQPRHMVANHRAEDLAGLQRQASALERQAQARTRAYQRATWIRFVGVFFPIPFVVVLLRLQIDAWTYYVWGALIIGSAAVLYMIDGAASAKADAAVKAAEEARRAYDDARVGEMKLMPP